MKPSWDEVLEALRQDAGIDPAGSPPEPVGGGSINSAWRLEAGGSHYFLKLNSAEKRAMFEAEAEGLGELARAEAVRVPAALAVGAAGAHSFLLLEWIVLGRGSRESEIALGERLALQHSVKREQFGWTRDNTIGSTIQINTPNRDWLEFLRDRRLGFQLRLAARNGYGDVLQSRGRRLLEILPRFFEGHRPEASLLHGDLWGGNWGTDDRGQPVIFDPAVYYGDRECDIAMTRLFGGFGQAFYDAYERAWPLSEGGDLRVRLYNLYHVLNHLNLFGGGYLAQAQQLIDSLLAEV